MVVVGCFYLIILSYSEVNTFYRLTEVGEAGVGTELLLLTDNITAGGAAVLDRSLLASTLLLPPSGPRPLEVWKF